MAADLRHGHSTQFGCFVVCDEIVDQNDIWRLVQHFHLCSEHRSDAPSLVETRQGPVARGIILQRQVIMYQRLDWTGWALNFIILL